MCPGAHLLGTGEELHVGVQQHPGVRHGPVGCLDLRAVTPVADGELLQDGPDRQLLRRHGIAGRELTLYAVHGGQDHPCGFQQRLRVVEKDLEKVTAAAAAGRCRGAGKIGERAGRVIGKHKVAKHFIIEITDTSFACRRDQEQIAAEAALDGIYVIRTSVTAGTLGPAAVITACKNLKYVERDFRIIKAGDLDLRPIYHYLGKRVRAHVLIAMIAAYLIWHLRAALAELTYTDQHIPAAPSPVASAQRSAQARSKDTSKQNDGKLPVRKYGDLLGHLSTLDRQTITFSGQQISKLTEPTPVQRRAFELLGAPSP